MKQFKLIRSGALSAAKNMALDAEIFQGYLADGIGVLRLYRWQAPAFTYGFSQTPESLMDFSAAVRDKVEVVKRITGGGILFHDDEITYSFVGSKADFGEPQGVFVDYRNICEFLLRFYKSLGLHPQFALETAGFRVRSAPDELCAGAYEKYDLCLGGKKIGGNAQKRNRQAIFQHGSLPCRINWDLARKYLPGLPKDISNYVTALSAELKVVPEKEILEQKLIDAFAQTFKVTFI